MTEPTSSPVVVVGAGGYVGSRLTAGLARSGRTVLAASRRPLPDSAPDGGSWPGRVRPVTSTGPDGLGDAVREACSRDGLPLPGGVIASIGGWQLGARLLDEPDLDGWRDTLDSHLTAHLAAVRALVPVLRDSAGPHPAYVVLNGAARDEPMAGSGAVNVTGAGLAMLVRVLNLEEGVRAGTGPGEAWPGEARPRETRPGDAPGPARTDAGPRRRVRFHELVIDHAVAGDDRNVTPDRTVAPSTVTAAVLSTLTTPTTPAVVHV
ncbi:NAD(P)-dependent dehydrogenase (short-subunit alcohol dehydrogenase family) [Myceligenerans xiligouense]|uniref:NAD(P)-dependent dehydrogenase (Short-subunit alcohol dehydrogenase family) n=1 Tax=Myceligenerans xiligouense TaxID=253184 RepID=A0A3N4Z6X4_9MICO|nr:NAD(P)-dependent dehydrogenase (short-subunit alcohol dehydrogenase family) [Myceligenerans xiligouense]